jgi:threonine synthase
LLVERPTSVTHLDAAITAALGEAAREEGLLMCPEGAATYATYKQSLADGRVKADEQAVLFNCATGLKYPLPPITAAKPGEDKSANAPTPRPNTEERPKSSAAPPSPPPVATARKPHPAPGNNKPAPNDKKPPGWAGAA